jgi:hypothetical protein
MREIKFTEKELDLIKDLVDDTFVKLHESLNNINGKRLRELIGDYIGQLEEISNKISDKVNVPDENAN